MFRSVTPNADHYDLVDAVLAVLPADRCICRKSVCLAHHATPVAGCPWYDAATEHSTTSPETEP
ncbi:hypothetical protein [Streptomyces sp. NBC_00151]|uniref:hypothetical protein n=1 Tax=Streptomyces sp. NBC_00151 TaxID=2975669 RepID=UPI002DD917E7|nr:hypothetical protein [Streptomyces sp. NBC_00151]WRZ44592.1 hypothetical protein OG915_45340 [Streptomyces sp. NBC_00151]